MLLLIKLRVLVKVVLIDIVVALNVNINQITIRNPSFECAFRFKTNGLTLALSNMDLYDFPALFIFLKT